MMMYKNNSFPWINFFLLKLVTTAEKKNVRRWSDSGFDTVTQLLYRLCLGIIHWTTNSKSLDKILHDNPTLRQVDQFIFTISFCSCI